MIDLSPVENQIQYVTNFQDLVSTPFYGKVNAIGWTRKLEGDFSEIVNKLQLNGNTTIIEEDELSQLQLSDEGQLARIILLNDLNLLKTHGSSPILNLIKCYDRDENFPYFPTDVYSFHVDRSPIPTDTFLCTYHGEPSEILLNSHAEQKVLIPEIRSELRKLFNGAEEEFETFLQDNFFDLHYQPKLHAAPINLGIGNMWKLAVDHPGSKVLPCLHRAPKERVGEYRLLMIC